MSDPQSDELSRKLRTWVVTPNVPADFQREIWQRLAVRPTANQEISWSALLLSLSALMAQPRNAIVSFILLVGLGLGIAHFQAAQSNERSWKSLEVRYANSVNPLATSR